jgi:hypothetical protein
MAIDRTGPVHLVVPRRCRCPFRCPFRCQRVAPRRGRRRLSSIWRARSHLTRPARWPQPQTPRDLPMISFMISVVPP